MADRWWVGAANDGDWGNTNNWASSRFGAGGAGVPASNDAVYVWDTAQAITQGLSQGSVDLNLLDIRFAGTIGTNSTALVIAVSGVSGASLRYAGTGAFCNITAGTNGIDLCHVISTSGIFRLAGGTTAALYFGQANIEVAAAAIVSGEINGAGGRCLLDYNATGVTQCYIGGNCYVESKRSITTLLVSGESVCRMLRAAALTSVLITDKGRLEHMSSGTIAAAIVLPGGVATTNGNQTLATVSVSYKFEGANLFDHEPGITFTADPIPIGATR